MFSRALIILNLLLWFCNVNVQAESADFDVDPELFPVPENLKPNVNFWIDVFTKYNSRQVILHDNEKLDIIYKVIDFSEFYGDSVVLSKKHWKKTDQFRDYYKKILKKLSVIKPGQIDNLSPEESRVYYLFKDRKASVFRRAERKIRAQKGLSDHFKQGLIRSGLYINEMRRIFQKHGLPGDLICLPHVESSFNIKSYSRVGAAGMWQFTRRTGRRFMKINYAIDERCDPFYSSEAAAKLLKDNYQKLNSWPLAITAYNHGQGGMRRAVKICNTSDFGVIVKKYKSRMFGFASRNFYAEFIAAVHVRKNYTRYFGKVDFAEPQRFSYFEIPDYIDIKKLSANLKLDIEQIKSLNPALRKPIFRSQKRIPRGFKLRIPWQGDADIRILYADIPVKEKHKTQISADWYQIQRGENLKSISKKLNVSTDSLLAFNDIQDANQIFVGEVLRLSREHEVASRVSNAEVNRNNTVSEIAEESALAAAPQKSQAPEIILASKTQEIQKKAVSIDEVSSEQAGGEKPRQKIVTHQEIQPAKKTESTTVAGRFTDSDRMERQNKNSTHWPEMQITYTPTEPEEIVVQPDETLGHFADWLEVPTRTLRKINRMHYGQDIQIGDEIKLSFSSISWQEFYRRRMEFHKSIEEDFFEHFMVENVRIYQIKAGENIWYLCNQVFEIPYWLMLKYNAHIDLKKLRINDEIIVPVLSTTTSLNVNEEKLKAEKG